MIKTQSLGLGKHLAHAGFLRFWMPSLAVLDAQTVGSWETPMLRARLLHYCLQAGLQSLCLA